MSRSFKPEVIAGNTGHWAGNALRFATREEAEAQVFDLMMRWTAVRDTRVVESDDPPNYRWGPGGLERILEEDEILLAAAPPTGEFDAVDFAEGGDGQVYNP